MAKPLQKERENRSADKRDLVFHPYTITPETAHTSILLLLSKEPEIICQTLRAITKFCAQDRQNRIIIYDLDGLDYILPHIDNPELNIRRFALKALAQLCQIPHAPEQVLKNPSNLKRIAQHLVRGEDVFVLEFASLVLAELTREPVGCEQLISANILATLFSRMKNSEDPDVQKNCTQILSNLLDDPVCSGEVTKNPNFSWPSLLILMHSPFLAIQHIALRTVDQLICRYKDTVVQKSFRASPGVLELCDILESYEFRDVHTLVLGVIKNCVELEENAIHLYQSGCVFRLMAYLEMAIPAMKPHCLSVLTKMSHSASGRESLFQTGTDLVFCHQLMTSNVDLLADAAMGVANMTKLLPSAIRMCDTNIIEALCGILSDDTAAWFNVRVNALRALAALCATIPKAAIATVDPKTFAVLRNINKKYKEYPIEAQRLAVQCYINLLNFNVSIKSMLNGEFISEMLKILERIDICLKIMTCTLLSGLMAEDMGKDLFTMKKGEEAIYSNLEIGHVGLRTALCTLIIASVTDEGADTYLELGAIHYMVENKLARYTVNAWEPALEAIFDHHPSAKFAYRGRLEINNFTKEGFYVMKRLESPLPTLKALMTAPLPHCNPALLAALMPPHRGTKSETEVNSNIKLNNDSNIQQSAQRLSVTRSTPSQSIMLTDDPNLREYILKLKLWFGDPRSEQLLDKLERLQNFGLKKTQTMCLNTERNFVGCLSDIAPLSDSNDEDSNMNLIMKRETVEAFSRAWLPGPSTGRSFAKSLQYLSVDDTQYEVRYREKCDAVSATLKHQAEFLAEFVQEQMCGLTQEKDCSMPSVDLHLADLMMELKSRVVGLGYVRRGGPLERAILYKVLADRLAIPCALVRNGSGYACCQVAVPEIQLDYEIKADMRYPAGLLRENYAVDLMSVPPKLVPMRSYEATKVCGPWCNKPYTAKSQVDICKCDYTANADTT